MAWISVKKSTSVAGGQARGLVLEQQGDLLELLSVLAGVVSAEEELAGQPEDSPVDRKGRFRLRRTRFRPRRTAVMAHLTVVPADRVDAGGGASGLSTDGNREGSSQDVGGAGVPRP